VTKRASVIPLVYTPDASLGRVRARIIAQFWDHPRVVRELREGEPDPSQQELDDLAASIKTTSGVPPTVRVIEVMYKPPLNINPLDDAA
jgi:hypothetical protein